MNRSLIALVLAAATAVFLALGGFIATAEVLGPPDSADTAPHLFEVERGQSFRQVAARLEDAGYIRSAFAFRFLGEVRGAGRKIRAGFYALNRSMDAKAVLLEITGSSGEQTRVTIPEGWDIRQIAAMLESKGLARADDVIAAAQNPEPFRQRYPWLSVLPPGGSLEGFLFPDTYSVAAGAFPLSSLLEMMLARFEQVAWPEIKDRLDPMDPFRTLTLASIVEREAVRAAERPLIAGVYLNRLRIGMALGADPTVEYALGRRQDATHNLTLADVGIDSPYNTYRRKGLPPGPIANPGLASLRAVLQPERTGYLYFVARGDGSHQFSRTYKEQLAAQRHFQRHR